MKMHELTIEVSEDELRRIADGASCSPGVRQRAQLMVGVLNAKQAAHEAWDARTVEQCHPMRMALKEILRLYEKGHDFTPGNSVVAAMADAKSILEKIGETP